MGNVIGEPRGGPGPTQTVGGMTRWKDGAQGEAGHLDKRLHGPGKSSGTSDPCGASPDRRPGDYLHRSRFLLSTSFHPLRVHARAYFSILTLKLVAYLT